MVGDDLDALECLIRRRTMWLSSLCRRFIGPMATKEDIEEVVSDVFFNAWEARETYDPGKASVRTWMSWFLIARSSSMRKKLLRAGKLRDATIHEAVATSWSDKGSATETQLDSRERLHRAYLRLAPADADLIRKRFVNDETPAAIARELGLPSQTVRVRLFRARARLRKVLEEE
ncbi:MAG: sigma-70 family RNA polymerase sigma factor [Chloroflexia bacterium]